MQDPQVLMVHGEVQFGCQNLNWLVVWLPSIEFSHSVGNFSSSQLTQSFFKGVALAHQPLWSPEIFTPNISSSRKLGRSWAAPAPSTACSTCAACGATTTPGRPATRAGATKSCCRTSGAARMRPMMRNTGGPRSVFFLGGLKKRWFFCEASGGFLMWMWRICWVFKHFSIHWGRKGIFNSSGWPPRIFLQKNHHFPWSKTGSPSAPPSASQGPRWSHVRCGWQLHHRAGRTMVQRLCRGGIHRGILPKPGRKYRVFGCLGPSPNPEPNPGELLELFYFCPEKI